MRVISLLISLWMPLCLNAQMAEEINQGKLQELIGFSKQSYTDEFILIHKGEKVAWWKNSNCDSLYMRTASMVKSWTGLVVGQLIDKGYIESENDLVCEYLPTWKPGCELRITIKQLLTMSAGLERRRGAEGILAVDDMHRYALSTEPDTLPGIRFSYSNESVQLLGLMIEQVYGTDANSCFRDLLFDPLGMDSTELAKDPSGNYIVYGGAKTTVEDASRIGLLMLAEGLYKKKRVIPGEWTRNSVTPSALAPFYGYLWWIDNNSKNRNFAATGDGGQLTIVFPDLKLVYVRRQSCNLEISGNMPWMGPAFIELVASTVKKTTADKAASAVE